MIVIRLIAAALLAVGAIPEVSNAQSEDDPLPCNACRNPRFHPLDWANFAYNQVFGPSSWMNADQADSFWVENPAGHTLLVDMNLGLGTIDIPLPGVVLKIPYPTDLIVQIILHLADGSNKEFTQHPSKRNPNKELPVGRQDPPDVGSGGGGGGGGRSGGPPDDPPDRKPKRCGVTMVDGGSHRRTCIR